MTGTGTQTDPYIVSTLADLRTAVGTAGAYVEMDPDASTKILDLNGSATNPVTQRLDINCASLAGNGWRIRNLYFSPHRIISWYPPPLPPPRSATCILTIWCATTGQSPVSYTTSDAADE